MSETCPNVELPLEKIVVCVWFLGLYLLVDRSHEQLWLYCLSLLINLAPHPPSQILRCINIILYKTWHGWFLFISLWGFSGLFVVYIMRYDAFKCNRCQAGFKLQKYFYSSPSSSIELTTLPCIYLLTHRWKKKTFSLANQKMCRVNILKMFE